MNRCNYDCFNCIRGECDVDELSLEERKQATERDRQVLESRILPYDKTSFKRQNKSYGVDSEAYRKAQNHYFYKKYKEADPEKFRRLGRENYHKHREQRRSQQHEYYQEHREELLEQKKSYYQANKEVICAKAKERYVPKPKKPLIDTEEAKLHREQSKAWYHAHKDEINARRRERRNANKNNQQTGTTRSESRAEISD